MSAPRVLVAVLALLTLGGCGHFGGGPSSSLDAASDSPATFGILPDAQLVDATGAEVSPARLRGSTWALATLTRPVRLETRGMLERLRDLQQILSSTDIRLVSLSTDPLVDTPEVLAGFAAAEGIDLETWMLWTGSEAEVARLLSGAWRSALVGATKDQLELSMSRSFESRVVVIDAAGEVRGTYDLFHEDGPEALVARLRSVSRE
jgi:cytochrome oxidase Cu insertion factor (SCO1/SenC/PrrC family)